MIGADSQLKSVGCILSLDVFEVQCEAGVVNDHVQLLSSCLELADELTYRLQRRQVQLQ